MKKKYLVIRKFDSILIEISNCQIQEFTDQEFTENLKVNAEVWQRGEHVIILPMTLLEKIVAKSMLGENLNGKR